MVSAIGGDMVSICATPRWWTLGRSRWKQGLPLLDQILGSGGKSPILSSLSSQLVDVLAQARCLEANRMNDMCQMLLTILFSSTT